jgi:EPS-associated MarR family transcriptional regulator
VLSEELRYRILKVVDENPATSQRELAEALGISVGKVNYCLKALITKGLVKIRKFKNSRHKAAYLYVLTPSGVRERVRVALRFLEIRRREYEILEREIAALVTKRKEIGASAGRLVGIPAIDSKEAEHE